MTHLWALLALKCGLLTVFSIPNGKAEWAMSSTSWFRFLCVEYQKSRDPDSIVYMEPQPPGMAKLLRRNWRPGKSLFNGSFPWDHFRLFFVAGGGEGGRRKKRKDLSLKQIYCPLVTSLNLFFLILTWRWILARHENAPPLGYRPRQSLFFLVSFDFGVRSFTLLMEMIMSWNLSKLYKWFHCIWVFLFSWINHTDVTNESYSVSQMGCGSFSFCTIINAVLKSVLSFFCIKNEPPPLKFWYHFWHGTNCVMLLRKHHPKSWYNSQCHLLILDY